MFMPLQAVISGKSAFWPFPGVFMAAIATLGSYNMGRWDTTPRSHSSGGFCWRQVRPSVHTTRRSMAMLAAGTSAGFDLDGGMNLATTFRSHPRRILPEDTIDTGKIGIFDPRRYDLKRFDPRYRSNDPRIQETQSPAKRICRKSGKNKSNGGSYLVLKPSMTHEFGDYLRFRNQDPGLG